MAYTHKMVDGELIPLTPEEIAALEAQDRQTRQQMNIVTKEPGPGPSMLKTLVPLSRGGQS